MRLGTFHHLARHSNAHHDPHFGKVTLLVQNIGAGASVVDRSKYGHTMTKAGTVTQDSAGARFSMPGLAFPSSPTTYNHVTSASHADLRLRGAGTWTFMARFKLAQLPTNSNTGVIALGAILASFGSGGAATAFDAGISNHLTIGVHGNGRLRIGYAYAAGAYSYWEHTSTLSVGTEYFLRLTFNGSTLSADINGVISSWAATLASNGETTAKVRLGYLQSDSGGGADNRFRGTIWAARLTKGVALPHWVGHWNLPFPVQPGNINMWTPGDGSGGEPVVEGPVGQHTLAAAGTWTVPADVTSVCIVCIGMRAHIAGTTLVQAQNGALVGDLVGAGGLPGEQQSFNELQPNPAYGETTGGPAWGGGQPQYIWVTVTVDGGGGGAGGYGSAGGNGGDISPRPNGAGKGGQNWSQYNNGAMPGQGASLLGIAPGGGTLYGGGPVNSGGQVRGNALAARNSIAVTPGQVITFEAAAGSNPSRAAARVIWGAGRSFPFNAT